MENFIIYMAKASGLIILFFLAYHFLLKRETFFTSNRWFLLSGLITSALLPLAEYTKVIWVAATPRPDVQTIDIKKLMQMQQVIPVQAEEAIAINWLDVVSGMYLAGVLFLLIRFTLDLLAIRKLLKGNEVIKDKKFNLIDTNKVNSPFSFFNYIVYNSAVLHPDELNSIISHEKVHSAQKHSLDMIISQLFSIVFWFNPFAWFYKKSISQNLEFIADSEAIKQLSDSVAYQKTLLKITIQPECIAITNHFYQSLIKKRIIMLNKQKSKSLNSWKYATILPVLVAFIFLFQVKVVAQEKTTVTTNEKIKLAIEITKDAKDSELEEQADIFKEEFDAEIIYSDLKRNSAGEIVGIKVTVKDKNQSKVYQVLNNKPIVPFTIALEKDSDSDDNSITFEGTNMRMASESKTMSNAILKPLQPKMPVNVATDALVIDTDRNDDENQKGTFVNTTYEGAIVYINGVKQKESDLVNIPRGQETATINVLSPKEAKKKYGKEAKNGAVEITTQKRTASSVNKQSGSFSYAFNDDFVMPNMDDIMVYTNMGIENGMDALAGIDWNEMETMVHVMSAEEKAALREDMKQVRIEIKEAMKEVGKEMKEAKKEMQKAKKDAEKARQESSKKSK